MLFDAQCMLHKGGTTDLGHPPLLPGQGIGAAQGVYDAPIVTQFKAHIGSAEGLALNHLLGMIKFGLLGAKKFAPGRGVKEQIPDLDRATSRVGGRLQLDLLGLPRHADTGAGGATAGITRQAQARHRGDTGQRFTPKTEGADGLQIIDRGNFTGGVATQGQRQILDGNTATVIPHPDQARTATLQVNVHFAGSRVQAVLQ